LRRTAACRIDLDQTSARGAARYFEYEKKKGRPTPTEVALPPRPFSKLTGYRAKLLISVNAEFLGYTHALNCNSALSVTKLFGDLSVCFAAGEASQ
jgi:hypothetical protein